MELNKVCHFPHLFGPLKFISGLGSEKANKLRDSVKNKMNPFIYSRKELNELYEFTNFGRLFNNFVGFLKFKTSKRNKESNKNISLLEYLKILPKDYELTYHTLTYSGVNIEGLSKENALKKVLTSDAVFKKDIRVEIEKNFNIQLKNSSIFSILSIIDELKNFLKEKGSGFEILKFSNLIKFDNKQLKIGQLVFGKITEIDNLKIKIKLFNYLNAELSFKNITDDTENGESFIKKIKQKLKPNLLINARILSFDDDINKINLFFKKSISEDYSEFLEEIFLTKKEDYKNTYFTKL